MVLIDDASDEEWGHAGSRGLPMPPTVSDLASPVVPHRRNQPVFAPPLGGVGTHAAVQGAQAGEGKVRV
jgi:hypothetical protein